MDDEFHDLDAAFWSLREASPEPTPVPGPDAARRTVRRRRTRTRLLVSTVVIVLFIGVMASLFSLEDRPATVHIAPASPPGETWEPSPLPTGNPKQLLDLTIEDVRAELVVPTGAGGCPAATLHFDGDFRDESGGVQYAVDPKTAAYGDLTDDGHNELAVVLSCQVGSGSTKRELIVMAASSPTTSQTFAVGHVFGNTPVEGIAILRGAIVLYSHPSIQNPATEIHRYLLIGDGRIAVEGPTAMPTS